jgi:hypothetical protein
MENAEFENKVKTELEKINFYLIQSKGMVFNDIITKDRQKPIQVDNVGEYIRNEYTALIRPENELNQIIDRSIGQSFKSKEEIYNHLVLKGLEPLTKPFNDEYRKLCVESKIM